MQFNSPYYRSYADFTVSRGSGNEVKKRGLAQQLILRMLSILSYSCATHICSMETRLYRKGTNQTILAVTFREIKRTMKVKLLNRGD